MAEKIIIHDGEFDLSAFIMAKEIEGGIPNNMQFLQCRFFQIGVMPSNNILDKYTTHFYGLDEFRIYVCGDGDVIFQFLAKDNGMETLDAIKQKIIQHYGTEITAIMSAHDFFKEFDTIDTYSALKAECFRKQRKATKSTSQLLSYMENDQLITTFRKTIQLVSMQRVMRVNPHILIVEDQIFSQKVLCTILKDYTCHIANTTAEAIVQYVEKCPDIVLLDIDLPDVNGHKFANFIRMIDKSSFIVMVTANQKMNDVQTAKKNNVMGFVPKPCKKDTILAVIDKFHKTRRKR